MTKTIPKEENMTKTIPNHIGTRYYDKSNT